MICLPFDSSSYRALRMVALGEIGAADDAGMLRHRSDDLPDRLVSALFVLRRDGYVTLGQVDPDPRDGGSRPS